MLKHSEPDVHAMIKPASIWVVSGANGSGKTTLLREFLETGIFLANSTPGRTKPTPVVPPTRVNALNARKNVEWIRANAKDVAAYVDPLPLSRDLTIEEHLKLVAVSWDGYSASVDGKVQEALHDFNIESLADRLPHQVSLGQSQLFGLALTFVRPAKIIVLDEPERHLDQAHTSKLAELISARAFSGTAFLIATHSPELVAVSTNAISL